MHSKGIPLNAITECINLTIDEVQDILNKHNLKNKSK